MFGAAAAGAGLAAGLIADAAPADAATGDTLKLGQGNTATATTTVTASNGAGLQGRTTDNSNVGVEGVDASGTLGYGVFGSSAKGFGVAGVSGAGTGVSGRSGNGQGVSGPSNSDTGVAGVSGFVGVSALSSGDLGIGLSANANGNGGTGIHGAVSGTKEGCIGVQGTNDEDPRGYGVYAEADRGTALYVRGTAEVTGTLSKGGGAFKIDHPLDPAHKYLYHSFVESPDMKNVYDGTVALDSGGRATVELPDWFETLNRDYRYQLTAIGAAAPDLHIAGEVAQGKFAIAGGRPGLKVSWQVTGIRQDAWANANRIPVEVDKPAHDQGRYLHADLYEDGHGEPIGL